MFSLSTLCCTKMIYWQYFLFQELISSIWNNSMNGLKLDNFIIKCKERENASNTILL